MEPTLQNINFMFDGPGNVLKPFMSRVFERLRRPDVDADFANEYIHALRSQWIRESVLLTGQGFTDLQKVCLESGIVETLLQYSQNPRSETDIAASTYLAMDIFQYLVRIANPSQRRKLYDELMRHNALEISLDKAQNHELCIHRYIGKALIRTLAQGLFLGESLSPRRTADLCVTLCKWTLEGPDRDSEELLQPEKTWQSQMMIGRFGTPPRHAAKYAKRWYAMAQEICMFSVQSILCRSPPPDANFLLGILQFKPEIIDMLLKIGTLPRTPWYPESQVDSLAFESLNQLMLFPIRGVPTLPLEGEGEHKEKYENESKATVKSIEILVSRPGWSSHLIQAWEKVENEPLSTIISMFGRVSNDYFAVRSPGDEMLPSVFSYRGQIRVAVLRLIAASAHTHHAKDGDLFSLLRIAYLGSQKFKPQTNHSQDEAQYLRIEHSEEICQVPYWAKETQSDVDYVVWTPREFLTGPIALLSVLNQLAKRGILASAHSMTELPEQTSPTVTLQNVQKILDPQVISKVISLSKRRIATTREEGRDCVKEKDLKRAHLLYLSASELAWSLLEFNKSSHGKFGTELEGVTKELVLCLGNATEMCLRRMDNVRAIIPALAVDWVLKHISYDEEISQDIVDKNKRRLIQATQRTTGSSKA